MWGSGIYSVGEYDAYLVYFVVVPLVVQIRTIRIYIGYPGNEMYFLLLKGCSHIFQLTLGSLSILVRDVIEAIWNHLYSAR